MKIVLIGPTAVATPESLELVFAELEHRAHTVLRISDSAEIPAGADLVLHLNPAVDDDGLALMREHPGFVVATTALSHRILRLSTGVIVRTRREARVVSAQVRRRAYVVPPGIPDGPAHVEPLFPTAGPVDKVRALSVVGPATAGRLVEIAYAISLLGEDAPRVDWRIAGEPDAVASVVEVCSALGIEVQIVDPVDMGEHLSSADVLLAPASTGEDPLTDDVVTALAAGRVVVMIDAQTDIDPGAYLGVGVHLAEELATAFRRLLDGDVDLGRIQRTAASHASATFTTAARADAIESIASGTLRPLRDEVDAMMPELATWGAALRDTPGAVHADDFRILQ